VTNKRHVVISLFLLAMMLFGSLSLTVSASQTTDPDDVPQVLTVDSDTESEDVTSEQKVAQDTDSETGSTDETDSTEVDEDVDSTSTETESNTESPTDTVQVTDTESPVSIESSTESDDPLQEDSATGDFSLMESLDAPGEATQPIIEFVSLVCHNTVGTVVVRYSLDEPVQLRVGLQTNNTTEGYVNYDAVQFPWLPTGEAGEATYTFIGIPIEAELLHGLVSYQDSDLNATYLRLQAPCTLDDPDQTETPHVTPPVVTINPQCNGMVNGSITTDGDVRLYVAGELDGEMTVFLGPHIFTAGTHEYSYYPYNQFDIYYSAYEDGENNWVRTIEVPGPTNCDTEEPVEPEIELAVAIHCDTHGEYVLATLTADDDQMADLLLNGEMYQADVVLKPGEDGNLFFIDLENGDVVTVVLKSVEIQQSSEAVQGCEISDDDSTDALVAQIIKVLIEILTNILAGK